MKVLVCIKSVIDPNIRVKLRHDGNDIDSAHLKKIINPFCEVALEEAIRMKESDIAREVVVVSVGPKECNEQIRLAIALGADRGIRIDINNKTETLNIAKLLKAIVEKEKPDLILLGKQSVDMDNNQTGQMLAALLNYQQATFVSKFDFVGSSHIKIQREVDQGIKCVSLSLPAIVTVDLRMNTPRHASLPDIIKAKKAEIFTYTPEQLNVVLKEHTQLLNVSFPKRKTTHLRLENIEQLIMILKNEGLSI
jgi:electron transfer flavoprotein beta subunit